MIQQSKEFNDLVNKERADFEAQRDAWNEEKANVGSILFYLFHEIRPFSKVWIEILATNDNLHSK